MISCWGAHWFDYLDEGESAAKKEAEKRFGHSLRRAPKLSVFALAALPKWPIEPGCALFLATRHGCTNDTLKGLDEVLRQGNLPMPFGFINTAPNAVAHYLTLCLGLQGDVSLLSAQDGVFEYALCAAIGRLQSGEIRQALVCYTEEIAQPPEAFAQSLGVNETQLRSFSGWLLLESGEGGVRLDRVSADCLGEDRVVVESTPYNLILEKIADWFRGDFDTPLQWQYSLDKTIGFRLSKV